MSNVKELQMSKILIPKNHKQISDKANDNKVIMTVELLKPAHRNIKVLM